MDRALQWFAMVGALQRGAEPGLCLRLSCRYTQVKWLCIHETLDIQFVKLFSLIITTDEVITLKKTEIIMQ